MSDGDIQDKNEIIIITEPAVDGVMPGVEEGDIVYITKSRNFVHKDYLKEEETNAEGPGDLNKVEGEDKTVEHKDDEPVTEVPLSQDSSAENSSEEKQNSSKPLLESSGKLHTLRQWLNKTMKILMTDGRLLVGNFLCTDRDANVILGSCTEHINYEACGYSDEPRILGLVMVPGRHIISIHLDLTNYPVERQDEK